MLSLTSRIVQEATAVLLANTPSLPLRTLHAVHLATATWCFARARRRGLAAGRFVAADHALLQAASWAGLAIVDPEETV